MLANKESDTKVIELEAYPRALLSKPSALWLRKNANGGGEVSQK